MRPNENFSEYLSRCRREKGFTLRKMADEIGISYAHLSDIERGRKAPPKEQILGNIVRFLDLDSEEKLYFYDLVATEKNTLARDVLRYLKEHSSVIDVLRQAIALDLTDDDWVEISSLISTMKG